MGKAAGAGAGAAGAGAGGGSGALLGGLIGAGGSIIGGQQAKPDPVDPTYSYYNPLTDPVLAGLSQEAMIGLGLPSSLIMQQASPVNQLINRINMNPAYTASQKQSMNATVRKWMEGAKLVDPVDMEAGKLWLSKILMPLGPGDDFGELIDEAHKLGANKADINELRTALFEMGFTEDTWGQFIEAESQWQQYAQGAEGRIGDEIGGIFDARLATQSSIGNLMSELAGQYGTGGQPGATAGNFMRNLEADINTTYDKQLEDVMRMAGSTGFNPGRAIADLEDSRASALRNLPQTGAMQAGQIISLLQGTLQPAQQLSAQAAGLRTGQNVAASTSAGNQASVINQIQGTINAQRAQAAGAGISGASSNLMNAVYLNNLQNQPGPATGGQPFTQAEVDNYLNQIF